MSEPLDTLQNHHGRLQVVERLTANHAAQLDEIQAQYLEDLRHMEAETEAPAPEPKYALGDRVRLSLRPETFGIVLAIEEHAERGFRHLVRHLNAAGDQVEWWYTPGNLEPLR